MFNFGVNYVLRFENQTRFFQYSTKQKLTRLYNNMYDYINPRGPSHIPRDQFQPLVYLEESNKVETPQAINVSPNKN